VAFHSDSALDGANNYSPPDTWLLRSWDDPHSENRWYDEMGTVLFDLGWRYEVSEGYAGLPSKTGFGVYHSVFLEYTYVDVEFEYGGATHAVRVCTSDRDGCTRGDLLLRDTDGAFKWMSESGDDQTLLTERPTDPVADAEIAGHVSAQPVDSTATIFVTEAAVADDDLFDVPSTQGSYEVTLDFDVTDVVVLENISDTTGTRKDILASFRAHRFVGKSADHLTVYPRVVYQPAMTLPPAPDGVSAVSAGRHITVSWEDVGKENNIAFVSYDLYHAAGEHVANAATPDVWRGITSTSFAHTLPADSDLVTHYYVVVAVNEVGESAPSVEISANVGGAAGWSTHIGDLNVPTDDGEYSNLRITGDLIVSGNNNSFTDVIYFGTLQNTGANNVFSWTDYSSPSRDVYLDPSGGSPFDSTGLQDEPWSSLAHVSDESSHTLWPGTTVFLSADAEWPEQLAIPSSGEAGYPITFTTYGAGAIARLSGVDTLALGQWEPTGTANIYVTSLPIETRLVLRNGVILQPSAAASPADIATDDRWLWKVGQLYLRDDDGDPDDGGAIFQVGQRTACVDTNAQDYLVIEYLSCYGAQQQSPHGHGGGILVAYGSSHVAVRFNEVSLSYGSGIRVQGASEIEIQSNTVWDIEGYHEALDRGDVGDGIHLRHAESTVGDVSASNVRVSGNTINGYIGRGLP